MTCSRCKDRQAAAGQFWCSQCKSARRKELVAGAPKRRRHARRETPLCVPDHVKIELARLAQEWGIIR